MKRYEMVKSHNDFNIIINKGHKISSKYMLIFSLKKDFEKPNFGLAIGKKVGNAVERNHLKRQFRNIVDKNRFLFKNYYNYIIMIKRDAKDKSFETLEKDLTNLLRKETNEK
jgi:ribonuclease P protein component